MENYSFPSMSALNVMWKFHRLTCYNFLFNNATSLLLFQLYAQPILMSKSVEYIYLALRTVCVK